MNIFIKGIVNKEIFIFFSRGLMAGLPCTDCPFKGSTPLLLDIPSSVQAAGIRTCEYHLCNSLFRQRGGGGREELLSQHNSVTNNLKVNLTFINYNIHRG